MALTIYDIAEKAGVSITTVSRVINGKQNVSNRTRARVLAVLKACGYAPSQLARGLASKATRTVGVLSVDIRDIHHSTIAYQVERTLSTLGYSSILCNLGGDRRRISSYLSMLVSRHVDGIILVGSVFAGNICREELEKHLDGSFPAVFINGTLPLPGVYGVVEQEEDACREAVDFLAAQGRRRIAFVGVDGTLSEQGKRRGYEAGMKARGLESFRAVAVRSLSGGLEATRELMERRPGTDAILYTDDITAAGGLKALLKAGYKVPEQVSVIGFNNSVYAEICTPALSSVDNKMYETGKLAASLLVDILAGKEAPSLLKIPCELVLRESTQLEAGHNTRL